MILDTTVSQTDQCTMLILCGMFMSKFYTGTLKNLSHFFKAQFKVEFHYMCDACTEYQLSNTIFIHRQEYVKPLNVSCLHIF